MTGGDRLETDSMQCALCCARARDHLFVNLEARDAVCWNDRKASGTMNAHLTFAQIAVLIAYAGGMAGGQVLFKMAALRGVADDPVVERLFSMMPVSYTHLRAH